jgi:hypothetical protein
VVPLWHEAEAENTFQTWDSGEVCTTGCYEYSLTFQATYWGTRTEAHQAYMAAFRAYNPGKSIEYVSRTTTGGANGAGQATHRFNYFAGGPWTYETLDFGKRSTPPYDYRTLVPMSELQLADMIANKSGWPSGSTAIDRTLADAVNSGLAEPLELLDPLAITGTQPTVSGTPKVTTNSDGSTTTETLSCSWVADLQGIVNYQCGTTTISSTPTKTTTETVVKSNPDGTTTTEVITKTTPGGTVTSTTTGEEPSRSDCDAGSNTAGCAELDTPTGEIPKSTRNITYAEDNLGLGVGACPEPVNLGPGRVLSFALICANLVVAKAMVLAMSAFTALLIVMGIKDQS